MICVIYNCIYIYMYICIFICICIWIWVYNGVTEPSCRMRRAQVPNKMVYVVGFGGSGPLLL